MFDKKISLRIKGVAILLLLFHHMFFDEQAIQLWNINFISSYTYSILGPMAKMARICVWIFTFISAYGLTIQFNAWQYKPELFCIKRWLKLMLRTWVLMVLILLFHIMMGKNPIAYYEGDYLNACLDWLSWNDLMGKETIFNNWYICFSQVLIFFIPFLFYACKKLRWTILPVFFIGQLYLDRGFYSLGGGPYTLYIYSILLGIIFAQNNYFDKLLLFKPRKFEIFECVGGIVCVGALFLLAFVFPYIINGTNDPTADALNIIPILKGILSLVICWFIAKYFTIPKLNCIMEFLGKYSMGIFLAHVSLFRDFPKLIFWSKTPFLSYCTLLVCSLAFAWIADNIYRSFMFYFKGRK